MKLWHRIAACILYGYLLVTLFLLIDHTSHSGSDALIGLALPFIALTLLLGFAISGKTR